MRKALRFLSLPLALGLGAALMVACSNGVPTGPDEELAPSFKKKANGNKPYYYDDITDINTGLGTGACASTLATPVATTGATQDVDVNGNGIVCRY